MYNLKNYYESLGSEGREQFLRSLSTSDAYMRHFLIARRRSPSPTLIRALVKHSNGGLSFVSLLCDLFPELREEIEGGGKTPEVTRASATGAADQGDTTGECSTEATDHVAPTKALRS